MNILIYIPDIKQEDGGVRQYSLGLLRLLSADNSNQYFIYHNNQDPEVTGILKQNSSLQLVTDQDVVVKKKYYLVEKIKNVQRKIFQKLRLVKPRVHESFTDRLCLQYAIDIVHCPYQFLPQTIKAKLITTLHDVQEIHFPEYFTAEARAYRANAYLDCLRRANHVLVSYQHVKNDLIKYFNVAQEKIHILLLNMEQLWFERLSAADMVDSGGLNIPASFLLYPANTWKHKNHLNLIKAIAYSKEQSGITINLVCTGHQTEEFLLIKTLVNEYNLGKQVFFTGIVDEKMLFTLYQQCRGVVIATAYEAGSFPLYESILMNRPVVCSNVTSLPETIGAAEFTFDPFDIPVMAGKMEQLWADETFRAENIKQVKLAAANIRHNDPLPGLIQIYESLNA